MCSLASTGLNLRGSTTVTQTSSTSPHQHRLDLYTYKPASYTGLNFGITTSLTAIPALTYTFLVASEGNLQQLWHGYAVHYAISRW